MKRDTEIIREFLLALIRDPDSAGTTPSGTFNRVQPSNLAPDLEAELAETPLADLLQESWDPLESELSTFPDLAFLDLDPQVRDLDPSANPVTHLGDLSAVQNRFQALLKDRLRSEIERHPPLFPWEKSTQEYPDTVPGERSEDLWINPLQPQGLGTMLPDDVFSTLVERCQEVVRQSFKSGVQLIKAVEGLFPDQPQTLQNVAQIVLQPAYRSAAIAPLPTVDYSQANTQQQVALTMLAAREILAALSLKVNGDRPRDQRQWQTAAGPLSLSLALDSEAPMTIRAVLPTGGYLALETDAQLRTERSQPGELQLELPAPESGQVHALVVGFADSTVRPIRFVAGMLDSTETP